MRKGRQTDLAGALGALTRRLDRGGGGRLMQVRVAEAWGRIAGETVADHTARAHLRNGELVVYVDSPIWATELSALAGPYAEALNEELGHNTVKAVRFAISQRVERERRQAAAEPAEDARYLTDEFEPAPLSEVERAQVEASAASIPGEALREAVIKATVAGMEREKGRRAANERQEPRDGL